jgi:hypothetical protein
MEITTNEPTAVRALLAGLPTPEEILALRPLKNRSSASVHCWKKIEQIYKPQICKA